MASRILMALSAGIIIVLGVLHLVYTFSGSSLLPRDPALQATLSQTHLSITKETTVLRAWTGFNASHSMGLIFFGLIFAFLRFIIPSFSSALLTYSPWVLPCF